MRDDGFSVCKCYLGANLQKVMYHLLCVVVGDGILINSLYCPILWWCLLAVLNWVFIILMYCWLAVLNWLLIILMYCIFVYFAKRFYVLYISFLPCWSPTSTTHLHSAGCAMIQTVKHWSITSGATVWSQTSLWDLWWKELHWDRFLFNFDFILSLAFYQCSILYSWSLTFWRLMSTIVVVPHR